MGDDHALFGSFRPLFQNIIGQTLGGSADDSEVHAVCAGFQLSAQTCCTKSKFLIKTFFDFFRVIFDFEQLFIERTVFIQLFDPFLVALFCVHNASPSCFVLSGRQKPARPDPFIIFGFRNLPDIQNV